MLRLIQTVLVVGYFVCLRGQNVNPCLPSFCAETQMRSEQVREFCNKEGLVINGRCCLSKKSEENSTVVIRGLFLVSFNFFHLGNGNW